MEEYWIYMSYAQKKKTINTVLGKRYMMFFREINSFFHETNAEVRAGKICDWQGIDLAKICREELNSFY